MEINDGKSFLKYYNRIKERTLNVIKLIPEDQLDFRLQPGAFSLGDLARHIILIERDMNIPNLIGEKSRYNGCDASFAPNLEAILLLYSQTMEAMKSLVQDKTDVWLNEYCKTPPGTPIRRWKWLRAMIEHEIHHRGQIYLMLQQLGVKTPPLFQLTSEEVIDLSENTPM